ncbi:Tannase/feruloyl esterase [Pestalotiopsis sp. NC0098]|nr:Tannase/feruloyl esterase [Pestalotiopsis sp. NC0098]
MMAAFFFAALPAALLISGTQATCANSSVSCASLLGTTFSGGTAVVRTAETILNGSNFTGTSANADYNEPQVSVPQACRLVVTVQTSNASSSAEAEVWLPPGAAWNGRLLTVGNGGFAGAVNYPDVVWGLRKGFASVSTDTGHASNSSDGSFLSYPEQSVDWGHRALHLSVAAAKEAVSAYYYNNGQNGTGRLYSYYAGCSTGGRQGLNAAERYPEDFDGVLAGAVPWQTRVAGWQTYVALLQFPNTTESYIPATKWPFVAAAVLDQCDMLDGAADDIIMDPSACAIDFDALTCGTGALNATACLSDAQTANLKRMYDPWVSNGTLVHEGLSPSGEASFSYLMNGDEPQFGPTWFRHAVFNDSSWDWATLTAGDVFFSDTINPGGANAHDPDLRAFEARGNRLLHYHGYADPLIPSLSAAAFYDTVRAFYAGIGRDADDVENFYRLFMVPGMGHCSSGAGAWVLDAASQGGSVPPVESDASYSLLYSLVDWVEGGSSAAPESIIGTKYVEDTAPAVQFQRPICRWPAVAEYDGVGDVDDVESWSCPVV